MLKDIIVIDDIFDIPENISSRALSYQYFNADLHPENTNGKKMYYSGFRTESLHLIDVDFYTLVNNTILEKIFSKSIDLNETNCSYRYAGQTFFHYMTKENKFDKSWFHTDPAIYAGLIYLNTNPPENTGTIIKVDGKQNIIENKYNRLVLYRSDYSHSAQNGFGDNIIDGRLTLTFSYNILNLNLKK